MVLQNNAVTEINKKWSRLRFWGDKKHSESVCLEQDGLTTLLRSVSILLSHLFSQRQERYSSENIFCYLFKFKAELLVYFKWKTKNNTCLLHYFALGLGDNSITIIIAI